MKTIPIIAFTGVAGSGKSTAANALISRRKFARVSFADPIRRMLKAVGVSDIASRFQKTEPLSWLGNKTPRQLMQTLGTEWGRQLVDSEIWVTLARRQIERHIADRFFDGIVVDDCRFTNEALMLREMGGQIYSISRANAKPLDHLSEAGVATLLVDGYITNACETADQFKEFIAARFL